MKHRSVSSAVAGLTLGVAILLAGCMGTPPPADPAAGSQPGGAGEDAEPRGGGAGDQQLLQRLYAYLENGRDKIDQGSISEGITQLVAVLAEAEDAGNPSDEIAQVVDEAETDLGKIGAALSLEPGMEWLDQEKNQIAGSSLEVGKPGSLSPSVIVTFNYGSGKVLVPAAPILFSFVKGSGLLTGYVAANDYGQANCAVASLDNPNQETVIRASLVYRVGGYEYAFAAVTRDFVFVPPARRATILVMEKAGDTVQQDPVILDSVYNALKAIAFDFSQYNGILLGEEFMKVFGGDPQAIRRLGLETEVSYLVMVISDGYNVSQVELAGKKYNIFKSQTTATTRIIRVEDGKILYSGTVQAVPGQGGAADKAVLDGLRNAAQAMADKLQGEMRQIDKALAGPAK
ncbi:MAG: hypothetical protein JW820_01555 [Spirochaetales bacterium]|nr:hypothetical protein [Spirochaetales bacterium]